MQTPPANIPAGARWEANWETNEQLWVIGNLVNGRREGFYRYYRADGTLCSEDTYINGVLQGRAKRFHENGEVSQEGEMLDGQKHGPWRWIRSAALTTELTLPAECHDSIWSSSRTFNRGHAGPAFFYTKEGVKVHHDGSPNPPRPNTIHEGAGYWPPEDSWYYGFILSNEQPLHRIGPWQWWNGAGILVRERVYNLGGKEIEDKAYTEGILTQHYKRDEWNNRCYEALYDLQGALKHQLEKTFDNKTLLSIITHTRGEIMRLRGKRSSTGQLACQCYSAEGLLTAEGQFDSDENPVGSWKFYNLEGKIKYELSLNNLKLDTYTINERFNPDWILCDALLPTLADQPLSPSLAEADTIEWDKLDGAYNKKLDKFPLYIRGLCHEEEAVRMSALAEIEYEAEHQGTLYEVTAKVYPFLIKALEHPQSNKVTILRFLQQVAETALLYLDEAEEYTEDEEESGENEWLSFLLSINKTIVENWPAFKALLKSKDQAVCYNTLMIVKGIRTEDVDQAIEGLVSSEHTDVRFTALHAILSRQTEPPADPAPYYVHPDPLVSAVTAIHLSCKFGPGAPAGTAELLIELFRKQDQSLYAAYMDLPFVEQDMYALIILSLGCVRGEKAFQALPELCAQIESQSPTDAITYGRGLLSLALGNGRVPFAPDFTMAIDTLARSQKFQTFINANDVLRDWNLPTNPVTLLELIDRVKASADPENELRTYILGEG